MQEVTPPLVVDLDGTLLRTDLLQESANKFLWSSLTSLPQLLLWLLRGRSFLKSQLSRRVSLDVESLPINQNVLDLVTRERKSGRIIVLATASSETYATQVAERLGVFDVVMGSSDHLNLKGRAKAAQLVKSFGGGKFDYVGDSRADVFVWDQSRIAYLVGRASRYGTIIRQSVRKAPLSDPRGGLSIASKVLKLLRVHQWAKNLLVFLPLLALHQFDNSLVLFDALTAFVVFGLAASSIYIVNDLIDLSNDRRHSTKRNRMLASGNVSILWAWLIWPSLMASSILLAFALLNFGFVLVLATYIVTTLAYSLRLKKLPVVDVIALAGLYTLRVVAGAAAISAPLSFWILTFAMFLFLSLALMKRFSEIAEMRKSSESSPVRGRGYVRNDLELVSSLGAASGLIAVLVIMLYVQDPKIAPLYASPAILWLTGPLLLTWIARAWLIAHRGDMHEDPIVFAIRDRFSYLIAIAIGAVFVMASVP
jgi:4-hydroxybenzoate polyprenyltransferase